MIVHAHQGGVLRFHRAHRVIQVLDLHALRSVDGDAHNATISSVEAETNGVATWTSHKVFPLTLQDARPIMQRDESRPRKHFGAAGGVFVSLAYRVGFEIAGVVCCPAVRMVVVRYLSGRQSANNVLQYVRNGQSLFHDFMAANRDG